MYYILIYLHCTMYNVLKVHSIVSYSVWLDNRCTSPSQVRSIIIYVIIFRYCIDEIHIFSFNHYCHNV